MSIIIPVIVTNNNFLVKKKGSYEFFEFTVEQNNTIPNVPFYHKLAKKVDLSIKDFKAVLKEEYNSFALSKPTFALILPDDTSDMESTFLQNFFLNSGKAVIITNISQILAPSAKQYVSLSKTSRAICLQYISDGEIKAERFYDSNDYDIEQIKIDITRLHIDIDYNEIPIYINNLHNDMDEFAQFGQIISAQAIKRRVCDIKIEKI